MSTLNVINNKQAQVLFVSELDLKTYTPISANKVTTSLINYIILAQDLYIKKNLGRVLYTNLLNEWIINQYNPSALPSGLMSSGTTMPIISGDTTNYQELYQQIKLPLVWWSYVLALPNIAIKVEETGIMLNSTDYSESSGMVGLDRLTSEGKMIATSYTKILQDYICEIQKPLDNEVSTVGAPKNASGIFIARKVWHPKNDCNC